MKMGINILFTTSKWSPKYYEFLTEQIVGYIFKIVHRFVTVNICRCAEWSLDCVIILIKHKNVHFARQTEPYLVRPFGIE